MNTLKIIAFGNQKGGVGKTALTLSIGRILANKGKRVLLIDTDSQTNLTTNLGINADEQPYTFADIMLNKIKNEDIENLLVKTDLKTLDIIPSSVNLDDVEHELVSKTKREYRFLRFMAKHYELLASRYDYILIDTKPQKSIINLNVFLVAEEVVLVTDIDISGVTGIKQQYEWWKYKCSSEELDEAQLDNMNYILLNNVEEHTNVYKDIVEFLTDNQQTFSKMKTLQTYISKTVLQKDAIAQGKSLCEVNAKHKVSRQYEALVRELYRTGIL